MYILTNMQCSPLSLRAGYLRDPKKCTLKPVSHTSLTICICKCFFMFPFWTCAESMRVAMWEGRGVSADLLHCKSFKKGLRISLFKAFSLPAVKR